MGELRLSEDHYLLPSIIFKKQQMVMCTHFNKLRRPMRYSIIVWAKLFTCPFIIHAVFFVSKSAVPFNTAWLYPSRLKRRKL